jgi:hypothetical protein
MTPTLFEAMFEINVAIVMLAVAAALFLWFRGSEASASARRMAGMLARAGLDPAIARGGGRRTIAVMNQSRRRCRRCPREDVCARWLAGKLEGGNAFCPNARTFAALAESRV